MVALTVLRLRGTNDLVFQRRDHRTDVFPGLLTFFGGLIEPGEAPRDAALREVNEETSLALAGTEELGPVGAVEVLVSNGPSLYVHLFEAVIDAATFLVYEGAGAEVYSRDEALARPDIAEHARTLLATLVR